MHYFGGASAVDRHQPQPVPSLDTPNRISSFQRLHGRTGPRRTLDVAALVSLLDVNPPLLVRIERKIGALNPRGDLSRMADPLVIAKLHTGKISNTKASLPVNGGINLWISLLASQLAARTALSINFSQAPTLYC